MNRVRRPLYCLLSLIIFTLLMSNVHATENSSDSPPISDEAYNTYFSNYDEPITREDFCYLVVSLMAELKDTNVNELYELLSKTQKTEIFDDVTGGNKYLALAKAYDLVAGRGEGHFAPDAPAERQEIAAMLYNLVRQVSEDHVNEVDLSESEIMVSDQIRIDDWAADAVTYVLEIGMMALDDDLRFHPTDTMTVEESILLISSFRMYLETPIEKPAPPPTEEEIIVEEEPSNPFLLLVCIIAFVLFLILLVFVIIRVIKIKKYRSLNHEIIWDTEPNEPILPHTAAQNVDCFSGIPQTDAVSHFPPPPGRNATVRLSHSTDNKTELFGKAIPNKCPVISLLDHHKKDLHGPFTLNQKLTIGRASENQLVLSDGAVSSNHCCIFWNGTQLQIKDIAARNPSKIRRSDSVLTVTSTASTEIRDGDILLLGRSEFKLIVSANQSASGTCIVPSELPVE